MRLIGISDLLLWEFFGDNIPSYAILSHTWGDEEVSYQEWQSQLEGIRSKHGYDKILRACSQASSDGCPYLWVDTVCKDKSSSTELSETINSMFTWYANSKICYAYIVDVHESTPTFNPSKQFESSRWFTRGWTLQELIAPLEVKFFSAEWLSMGSKSSLSERISAITGIDEYSLRNWYAALSRSIACRMSWASTRSTTRPEYIAYCILGLLGINMPLLYGEGPKAFIRLQEEILKAYNDHTLFCWTTDEIEYNSFGAMLASSSNAFRYSTGFTELPWRRRRIAPYSMTNFDLSITLPVIYTWTQPMAIVDAAADSDESQTIGIPLRSTEKIEVWYRDSFPTCPVRLNAIAVRNLEPKHLYNTSGVEGSSTMDSVETPMARRFFLLTFESRREFASCASLPTGLFDSSRSLFIVDEARSGYPCPEKQPFQMSDRYGYFSYGLLQLETMRLKRINLLLGLVCYSDGDGTRKDWYVRLLTDQAFHTESSRREFIRQDIQQEDSFWTTCAVVETAEL